MRTITKRHLLTEIHKLLERINILERKNALLEFEVSRRDLLDNVKDLVDNKERLGITDEQVALFESWKEDIKKASITGDNVIKVAPEDIKKFFNLYLKNCKGARVCERTDRLCGIQEYDGTEPSCYCKECRTFRIENDLPDQEDPELDQEFELRAIQE